MLIFNDARGFDLPLARIFARHLSTSLAWAKPSTQVALLVVKYPKRKHGETMRTCFCLKKKIPVVPLPLPLPYLYILYHFLPRGQGASSTLDLGTATSPPLLRANLLELLIQSAKRTPWNTAIAETNDTCFGLNHVKTKCCSSEFASTVRKRENGLSRLPLHTWQSYCAGCFYI